MASRDSGEDQGEVERWPLKAAGIWPCKAPRAASTEPLASPARNTFGPIGGAVGASNGLLEGQERREPQRHLSRRQMGHRLQ
jgi:hypothetical protein